MSKQTWLCMNRGSTCFEKTVTVHVALTGTGLYLLTYICVQPLKSANNGPEWAQSFTRRGYSTASGQSHSIGETVPMLNTYKSTHGRVMLESAQTRQKEKHNRRGHGSHIGRPHVYHMFTFKPRQWSRASSRNDWCRCSATVCLRVG